ncbi:MAG: alpha/beta-type small acid-soluble spore protein [Clostridiales bacterium]|nr:alpha/beta-type small acid-soluble spore protein [Clostridiales bacterium]MBQ2816650.1 alpha/beta-type small acid-soluble spore protein [Clostridia bacterium]MBQ4638515.1 alpha/beta-type small acid-soluble spore protein [Clostridia bacterium]
MASNNSGNRTNIPEAKQALNNMKFEIAKELGVNLKNGYNGDLTAKENGYVGGYMVKRMIEQYEQEHAGSK